MSQRTKPEFVRHVDDLFPTREHLTVLTESAEAVQRTIESPGFDVIRRVLAAEVAKIDDQLGGRTLEHAEYARLHGRRTALMACEDAAAAVTERAITRRKQAIQEQEAAESAGEAG